VFVSERETRLRMERHRDFALLEGRERNGARARLSLRTHETRVCARRRALLVAVRLVDVASNNEQPHQQPEESCQCEPLTMLMFEVHDEAAVQTCRPMGLYMSSSEHGNEREPPSGAS
jgi:hypothetical protein